MSHNKDSVVLSLLQPDLLSVEELIEKIQSRCKVKNLGIMSKEGLVELFRRVILPLPQRFYRTNRRGKMLTTRRAKGGCESRRKDEGFFRDESRPRGSKVNSRLKPPPEASNSHKIRDSSYILIKDRRKSTEDDERKDAKTFRSNSPSRKKIILKRSSADENSSSKGPSPTVRKMPRTAIKWP